jgi:hypothetical protein
LAQPSDRQRRKKRRAAREGGAPPAMARGYSRSREKDEQARAALKPLRPGERPTAVTVGAIVALLAGLANLVALLLNLGSGDSRKLVGTAIPVVLLLVVAWGMWRAKYWAVLGMETLLGLTIVGVALSGLQAQNLRAAIVVVAVLAVAGPLFWFLIKAMARIQMPTPPSARR